jgi:hypothetical protein
MGASASKSKHVTTLILLEAALSHRAHSPVAPKTNISMTSLFHSLNCCLPEIDEYEPDVAVVCVEDINNEWT